MWGCWLFAGAGWLFVLGERGSLQPQGLGRLGSAHGWLSAPLPSEPNALWFTQGHAETPQFGPWLFFCLSVTSGALL